MMNFGYTTLDEQFADDVSAAPARILRAVVAQYLTEWAKFWGVSVQMQGQPAGAIQQNKYAALTPTQRIASVGKNLGGLFALSNALKTFVESQANAYIQANGVPAANSSMAFLLTYITAGVFVLPGVPDAYTLNFANDGSGTIALATQTA